MSRTTLTVKAPMGLARSFDPDVLSGEWTCRSARTLA